MFMSKNIGRGTFVLIASGIICKALGALFRLPLTAILGIEGIGVFQMVMAIYSFALVLTSGGVAATLSKYVSQARARGDYGKIKKLLKSALTLSVVGGAVVGIIIFAFAKNVAALQSAPDGQLSYRLMLLLIPFGGVIASIRGIFQGYENMTPTAVSQILEQGGKFGFGLLFSYIFSKRGLSAGVFGAFLGLTISELVVIVVLFVYLKVKHSRSAPFVGEAKSRFVKDAITLSLGSSVLPLVSAIDSFIVVARLGVAGFSAENATALFGLQTGVVGALMNFPLIISSSIATALLPSVSYDDASLTEKSEADISKTLKIMWLMLIPLAVGMSSISRPLYSLIYPNLDKKLLEFAVSLTYFGAISTIISALMQFFVALLQAKGLFRYCSLSYLFAGAAKIVCVYFLCMLESVNIYGIAIGNIVFASIVAILALIRNKRKISIGFFDLSLPILSAMAMNLAIIRLLSLTSFAPIWQVVLGIALGGTIYIFFTLPISTEILKTLGKSKKVGQENKTS